MIEIRDMEVENISGGVSSSSFGWQVVYSYSGSGSSSSGNNASSNNCATAECAAGVLPTKSDNRTYDEASKSLCQTSVNISMAINPVEMPLSFISKEIANSVLGKTMDKLFCK
jgi:hypothetical protein